MLKGLYGTWNSRINVISRKDTDNFYIHHVLHSLAIAKVVTFVPGTRILDVGTGGGFPGIPLAIMFPECSFTLLDSIEKKIKVVDAISQECGLTNVIPSRKRVEEENGKYDFIVSRAVMEFQKFLKPAAKNISREPSKNAIGNGLLLLKGGELNEELGRYMERAVIHDIPNFFEESFFETKKVIYYPV